MRILRLVICAIWGLSIAAHGDMDSLEMEMLKDDVWKLKQKERIDRINSHIVTPESALAARQYMEEQRQIQEERQHQREQEKLDQQWRDKAYEEEKYRRNLALGRDPTVIEQTRLFLREYSKRKDENPKLDATLSNPVKWRLSVAAIIFLDSTFERASDDDPKVIEARKLLHEFWRRSNDDINWIGTLSNPMLDKVNSALDIVQHGGNQLVQENPAPFVSTASQQQQSFPDDTPEVARARLLLDEFKKRSLAQPGWARTLSNASLDRVEEAYNLVNGIKQEQQPPAPSRPAGRIVPDVALSPKEQAIINKMEKIVIPEIEFRQANIHDVIDFFVKASIAEDKSTTDPNAKGVNIILNLGGPQDGSIYNPPEITFTARYISLLQAVKIVTQVAGLKYHVEDNAFVITK